MSYKKGHMPYILCAFIKHVEIIKKYDIVGIYKQNSEETVMTISERLFDIMQEKGISMPDLSRMTGISRHTIFDWQRKGTNPGADKIMIICESLKISPEQLLIGKTDEAEGVSDYTAKVGDVELQIVKECHGLSDSKKRMLLAYTAMLQNMKE